MTGQVLGSLYRSTLSLQKTAQVGLATSSKGVSDLGAGEQSVLETFASSKHEHNACNGKTSTTTSIIRTSISLTTCRILRLNDQAVLHPDCRTLRCLRCRAQAQSSASPSRTSSLSTTTFNGSANRTGCFSIFLNLNFKSSSLTSFALLALITSTKLPEQAQQPPAPQKARVKSPACQDKQCISACCKKAALCVRYVCIAPFSCLNRWSLRSTGMAIDEL